VLSNPDDQQVRDGVVDYTIFVVIAGLSIGFATFMQVSQECAIVLKSDIT
jgi:hypothetical protein